MNLKINNNSNQPWSLSKDDHNSYNEIQKTAEKKNHCITVCPVLNIDARLQSKNRLATFEVLTASSYTSRIPSY